MGILNTEINYDKILNDLSACCLTEEHCGSCEKSSCIVGYAQNCITQCFKNNVTYVQDGSDNIPFTDFKVYNSDDFEQGIAQILKQCRSCEYNHFDNCVINIIRNCYEIGLFGEIQSYDGSNFRYLNQIHNSHPEIAERIIATFHSLEE